MKLGLTLPNVAFRPYTDAELAALDDLQPSVLVMLLYGGAIDQEHIWQLRPYLQAHAPRILYRPYAGNINEWAPKDWAKECFGRINNAGIGGGELLPANEFNIEGFGDDWQAQINWLTSFAAQWRKVSAMPIHLPALSPTQGYEYGVLAYQQAGLAAKFDIVDFHAYTMADLQIIETVTVASPQPCAITEYNQVASEAVAATQGIDAAVYFLLGGTTDQAQYDILKNPAAYDSFKKANQGGNVPSSIPAAPGYPAVDTTKIFLYSQWSAARIANHEDPRDIGAFLAHIKGLNGDASHPEAYGLPYEIAAPKAVG